MYVVTGCIMTLEVATGETNEVAAGAVMKDMAGDTPVITCGAMTVEVEAKEAVAGPAMPATVGAPYVTCSATKVVAGAVAAVM
mmetsp:Transcript_118097/g.367928  ORF Transcript_118097/g.367928 Transcript_118097/m.367928 type:complete len:83 (-) Transcript_118097:1581-1829(-)